MVSDSQLRKKAVFLGLDDVLISGCVDSKVNAKEVANILSNLEKIKEKSEHFFWGVVSGYPEKIGREKIKANKLDKFLNEKNCFFVTQEYIDSKSEFDKEVHLKGLEKDPCYRDEFFKRIFIEKKISELGFSKEETVFIGHDSMFDAYYLWKFAQIDTALLKESFSQKNKPRKEMIKNLIYAKRNWKDIQKILLGKYPKPDYAFLETAIMSMLKEELLDLPEIKRVVIEKKKLKEQNNK